MSRHHLDPGGDATAALRSAKVERALRSIERHFAPPPEPTAATITRAALLSHIKDKFYVLKYATNTELAELSALITAIESRGER